MIDIKIISQNLELLKQALVARNYSETKATEIVNAYETLIKQRSDLMSEQQKLQNLLNQNSKLIGQYMQQKKDTTKLLAEIQQVKTTLAELTQQVSDVQKTLEELLYSTPNIPANNVPVGSNEVDNVVLEQEWDLDFEINKKILPHYEIGLKLGILDFERAAKISGSRFVIYKNDGARLVRALANFMLDTHVANGYTELVVPTIVKEQTLYGTGQLPKFGEDSYQVKNSDLWLIATSEIPITNYHNDEIIDLSQPLKFTGYTRCYRSEAGSGGRDTKGLIRLHEFHKVEIVKITSQKDAESQYFQAVEDAANILRKLQIPFQKVLLCTGDLGFSSQKTIDLELWMPSENKYRETSSISLFGDFQARRAKIRYRDENKKTHYAYTINGSGLAIDRVIAAILEIYQNEDGTITIPKILRPYMNGQTKIG
ncbi:serine--tRNA ligase [Candidatus Mycoplasma pogonae]